MLKTHPKFERDSKVLAEHLLISVFLDVSTLLFFLAALIFKTRLTKFDCYLFFTSHQFALGISHSHPARPDYVKN